MTVMLVLPRPKTELRRLFGRDPFADGNKRTAFIATAVFLRDNGYESDLDDASIVQIMLAVSGGAMSEADLAAWLRERATRP